MKPHLRGIRGPASPTGAGACLLASSRRLAALAVAVVLVATATGPATPQARAAAPPDSKIGPWLARLIAQGSDAPVPVWVFFTDRAGSERDPSAFNSGRPLLSQRSLDRRSRRGTLSGLDASDLPVHEPYVRALVARGARLRGTSRWLDAASVEMSPRLAAEIARLPFVWRVELVPRGRGIDPVGDTERVSEPNPGRAGPLPDDAGLRLTYAPGDTAYYGGSFRQLSMMQVPKLHALGLSGAGVLVCMLDSGFHLGHQAFSGLQVVATRDFIHGDTNVDDQPGQDTNGQAWHGTATLSCVAGSKPGTFSGGAFGAAVALGKTEDISSETPVEMDYWQFGAEWADSLGADVISSSLGYSTFDPPYQSYTYADMDGRTTVVTLAAVEAARRGITVVTAAGNAGATSWHYIIAPADADSVITSGAVDSFNVVAGFSSRGPTSDGRTKPDVTAMGVSAMMVDPDNDAGYIRASGTSFSTPLTASVVALLLEAHPLWRPFEVREALRETALNHASPNNDIGWGLVQGLAARSWIPSTTDVASNPSSRGLELAAGPNPVRRGAPVTIRFAVPRAERVRLEVFDLAGRSRSRLFDGMAEGTISLQWTGSTGGGAPLPAGVYWIRASAGQSPSGRLEASRVRPVVLLP